MANALTISAIAIMTGLHRNTIRNYIKGGKLKATLVDEGTGRQRYLIDREDLYNCGIPKILAHLGPLEVQERLDKEQAKNTDDTFGEIIRLNRELLAAREELGILRFQVPALQAAQVERDTLREERDRLAEEKVVVVEERAALSAKAEVLEVSLEQARANARWGYRRQMKKAGKLVIMLALLLVIPRFT